MTVITYISRIVVGMVVGQKPLGVKYPEDLQLVINANANTPSYILVLETMHGLLVEIQFLSGNFIWENQCN